MKKMSAVVAAVSSAIVIAGCSSTQTAAPTPEVPAVSVVSNVTDGKPVSPVKPIEITVANGTLVSATIADTATGKKFAMDVEGSSRATSTAPLAYGGHYRVDYTVRDSTGQVSSNTGTNAFTTVSPKNKVAATVVHDGRKDLGIAEPVIIRFDEPIVAKKAAKRSVTVTSSDGQKTEGRWYSDSELHFRPAKMWAPGTVIDVDVDLYGKNFAGSLYGQKNTKARLVVKGEYTVKVSDRDKMVRVYRNGKQIKAFPTSMGKTDYQTYADTYYLTDDRQQSVRMVSNGAEPYDVVVEYGTRMSYDGIYFHAAPWAYGALGSYNQSHGCLNLRTEDAKWIHDNLPAGTPVTVTGTGGGKMPVWDGMSDWSIPFKDYPN